MTSQLKLLRVQRFLPLFGSQVLGAFNDNLFKSAFVMMVTFGAEMRQGHDPATLAALAGAALIAPFFLVSATAGELADRFNRATLMRVLKAAEIVIVLAASAALLTQSLALSLLTLFLLGTQSSLIGPLKYALLPQYLRADELVDGNALMESGTFLAILLGTIAGGITVAELWGPRAACLLLVVCAVSGFAFSLLVPPAKAPSPELRLSRNLLGATLGVLAQARESRAIWRSILGISWFWTVGAVYLSQLPAFVRLTLGAGSPVVTLFLAAFSIGVGVGSVLCARVMRGEISARYVPLAAVVMGVFSFDLAFASTGVSAPAGDTIGILAFLSSGHGPRIFFDLLGVAVAGGFFVVPLYAIMQSRSAEAARARIIAANNIVNALLMTGAAIVTAALLALGFAIPQLFLVLAVLTVVAALVVCALLPQDVMLLLARTLLRAAYRVEVRGLEHVAAAGDRVVIAPNHVSFLDGALIAAFLPGSPVFAIDTAQAARPLVRLLLAGAELYRMDPLRPMSTKSLIKAVQASRRCVIFPEGRLNVTGGALMKIYDGPALVADKAGATILPVRIDGIEFTAFSRLGGRLRRRWFPKVTLMILPPRQLAIPADARGRTRRQAAGRALYDVMSEMMARRGDPPSLFGALLAARAAHGGNRLILADPGTPPLSYDRLVAASLVLGRRLAHATAKGEIVGLLLPNSVGAAAAFFALTANGRVPAMLNYSAGADAVLSASRTASLKVVVTSRRFVELGRLGPLVERLGTTVRLLWLEDLRGELGLSDKLYGLAAVRVADWRHRRLGIAAGDPAVVLFTSGSEGAPKGVVLSHANLLANRRQLAARVDFSPADHVLNALPVFHSFGLSAGMLLPLLSGVRLYLYPSPLHYRIVPEIAYDIGATILFGTDTFLSGYARLASPYDFYALRYVFAGAEPVRAETRQVWAERFGKRLLEGYGVTECSPVIAVNTPMHFRAGTVGRVLPLIETRLEAMEGIDSGARLWLRGPNVMAGYLLADRPGVLQPPPDGWYDTGDIVSIDEEGFVTIVGRAKRFAKIGGEMISLAVAERIAELARPRSRHAVVTLTDPRRGEKLVLLTEASGLDRGELVAAAQRAGYPEIAVPREIFSVAALPLLGSGKTNYPAVINLANELAPAAKPSSDEHAEQGTRAAAS
jgi:acyl-[acyl-carrier-protein]-phospholipid O-acyltransferase/long-chain-fatty-acid--[acyl-carrier-protein] ligase